MTPIHDCEVLDPRIRRTRQLLQQALQKLLQSKDFEKISVQDIAEESTVNRATFYDHYTDKFDLLQALVGSDFYRLLAERKVQFDGTCASALGAIVLAVCDYLAQIQGSECERQRTFQPLMESAIVPLVRRVLLDGLKTHPPVKPISPEMVATTAAWAIYGAAREWVNTPQRGSSEEIVGTVVSLVAPVLEAANR